MELFDNSLRQQPIYISCTEDKQQRTNPRNDAVGPRVDTCNRDNTGPQNLKACFGNMVCYLYEWNERPMSHMSRNKEPEGHRDWDEKPWSIEPQVYLLHPLFNVRINSVSDTIPCRTSLSLRWPPISPRTLSPRILLKKPTSTTRLPHSTASATLGLLTTSRFQSACPPTIGILDSMVGTPFVIPLSIARLKTCRANVGPLEGTLSHFGKRSESGTAPSMITILPRFALAKFRRRFRTPLKDTSRIVTWVSNAVDAGAIG